MFKATPLVSAFLLGITALIAEPAQAAKPVHQEGLVEESFYVYVSSLQDLTTDVVIHKTIFRDFDAIYTTITLNMVQDSRGKLNGVAEVGSTEMESVSVPVTGKMKARTGAVSLTLKGAVKGEEDTTKLSIKSTLSRVDVPWTVFYVEDPLAHRMPAPMVTATTPGTRITEIVGPDSLLAVSSYRTSVNFASSAQKYNFVADHEVKGFPLIEVQPALPEDVVGLSPKHKYFEALVPFGVALGTGVANLTPEDLTTFAVKANKISVNFLGQSWMGGFLPQVVSGKIGPVKVAGPVNWPPFLQN